MFIAPIIVSPWAANCYLVGLDSGPECVVIDPGISGAPAIEKALADHGRTPVAIIGTHGHLDHVGDAATLATRFGVPVYLHPADRPMLTRPAEGLGAAAVPLIISLLGSEELPEPPDVIDLVDAVPLTLAGVTFVPAHAPGHTAGSTLLRVADADVVFTGDVLFAGAIGRMDLPGGSPSAMKNTIRCVLPEIPVSATLYPGHGAATTMADERATNPYLQPPFWK